MPAGKKAGQAYITLGIEDKLGPALERAQKRLQAFGEGVKAVGMGMMGIGGAAVAGLLGAAHVFSEVGSAVHDLSQRTGLSAEAVSELGYAAKQSDVELGALEAGVRKMQKTIAAADEGSQGATDSLMKLGLAAEDLRGKTPEEQFTLLADRISQIEDPTMKAAAAMEVFGKSGTALLPMIEGGADGLGKMRKEAKDFRLSISKEDADNADALGDAVGLLGNTLKMLAFNVGAALAPLLTEWAMGAANVVVGIIDWVKENKDLIVTGLKVAAVVVAVGAGLVTLGVAIVGIGAVLGGIVTVCSTIAGVVTALIGLFGALLTPIGLIIGVVVAAGAALFYFSDVAGKIASYAGKQFNGIADDAGTAFDGIRDSLMSGDIEGAARILWQGLKTIWARFTGEISKLWTNWVHDLAGAFLVIKNEAAAIFDSVTTTGASWITEATNALGIDEFVLGVDLNDDEVAQSKKLLQDQLKVNDKKRNQQLLDEIAALEQSRQAELDAADRALESERAKLKELAAQAKKDREAKQRGDAPEDGPKKEDSWRVKMPKLQAAVADAQTRMNSIVTFNPFALSQMQSSNSPLERIAKATERTAKATEGMEDSAQEGGLLLGE